MRPLRGGTAESIDRSTLRVVGGVPLAATAPMSGPGRQTAHPPAIPIHYARTQDGLEIAYWRLGRGPVMLHSPNVQLGHLREEWSVTAMRRWYTALARSFAVVRYDH
ncbi:MAG: hypothetical protein GWN71_15285, partial [Gammaproteobacteria bacterium]|nr:hypothetical protein [Gemmatimonadota bacterium]NIU74889.1 hypothetical protein [Gammaproteobacteria bacterium]